MQKGGTETESYISLSSSFLNSKEDKEKGGWRVERKVPNFAELNTLLLKFSYAP